MTDLALPHPGRWLWLGAAAGGVVAATLLIAHAATPEYGVPRWGIAVAAVLLAAVLAGARLVWTTGGFGLAVRVAAGVAVVVLGLLTLASIGLPVLLAGVVLLAAAARPARGRRRTVVGAGLIGAALPVLVLLALSGPVVTCRADGVSTQENAFMTLRPSYSYTYACDGARLTSFHLRWR